MKKKIVKDSGLTHVGSYWTSNEGKKQLDALGKAEILFTGSPKAIAAVTALKGRVAVRRGDKYSYCPDCGKKGVYPKMKPHGEDNYSCKYCGFFFFTVGGSRVDKENEQRWQSQSGNENAA